MDELGTGSEWAAARANGIGEGNRDDILDSDEGGLPTAVGKATVQPVNAAIGTGCLCGFRYKAIG